MTSYRRPRVFLSYRHQERTGLFASGENQKHVAWVEAFAHALGSWNVDVIWDGRMRDLFRPHTKADPMEIPFMAEVSTLCLMSAQAFMPIVTRGYLERVSENGIPGVVTQEWQRAVEVTQSGKLEILGIVREWPTPGYAAPPAVLTNGNSWDFRFVDATRDEVELLGDKVHLVWEVNRPPVDMPFAKLISTYLKFCVEHFGLHWPGIERWGCDFARPGVFLDIWARLHPFDPVAARREAQREMSAQLTALGVPTVHVDPATYTPPTPEELAREAELEAKAEALARSAASAHLARVFKPFDYANSSPRGRASKGLYFGKTVKGFSYLA